MDPDDVWRQQMQQRALQLKQKRDEEKRLAAQQLTEKRLAVIPLPPEVPPVPAVIDASVLPRVQPVSSLAPPPSLFARLAPSRSILSEQPEQYPNVSEERKRKTPKKSKRDGFSFFLEQYSLRNLHLLGDPNFMPMAKQAYKNLSKDAKQDFIDMAEEAQNAQMVVERMQKFTGVSEAEPPPKKRKTTKPQKPGGNATLHDILYGGSSSSSSSKR
jgi:hypothetical protein